MAKKTLLTTETNKSVPRFIDSIDNKKRQSDSRKLLEIMKEITGKDPKIWGNSIVGFGNYKYSRKNGEEYDWFDVGFSPGKPHMTVYVMYDIGKEEKLLEQLGPHKHGRGCLYIKDVEAVNQTALKKIIRKSDRWTF